MKGILKKLRHRNIQTNFPNFLLVIFVVAVSISLAFGLIINSLTLKFSINRYYSNTTLGNLWVEKNAISDKEIDFFKENFTYSSRFYTKGTIVLDEQQEVNARIYVSNGRVSAPFIESGGKGGCYIDKNYAKKYRLKIGETNLVLPYTINDEEIVLTFRVTGTCSFAEDLINDDGCAVFIDEKQFESVLQQKMESVGLQQDVKLSYNQVVIYSKNVENDKNLLQNYFFNENISEIKILDRSDIKSISLINQEIVQAENIAIVVAIILTILIAMIIISTINQFIFQEEHNVGILKALGVRNRYIINNLSGYGSILCFVGGLLGILIAPLIVPNVAFGFYDKTYTIPEKYVSMFNPLWLNLSVLLAMVVFGYLVTFLVVLKIVRKTASECLKPKIKIKLKNRKKRKTLFPKYVNMAFRNLKLNISRTIMTIVGASGSVIFCVIGIGLNHLNNLTSMEIFLNLFREFSIIILALVFVTMTLQILGERVSEIATMRLLGESYFKIWLSVVLEIIFVGFIGLSIGLSLSQAVFEIIYHLGAIPAHITIGVSSYFIVSGLVVLFICLLSAFVFYRVSKLKLSDAILTDE